MTRQLRQQAPSGSRNWPWQALSLCALPALAFPIWALQHRLDPVWLAPMAGFALAGVAHGRSGVPAFKRLAAVAIALLAFSITLTLVFASSVSWQQQGLFGTALAGAALLHSAVPHGWAAWRRVALRLVVATLFVPTSTAILDRLDRIVAPAERPRVLVMSSLPLQFLPMGNELLLRSVRIDPLLAIMNHRAHVSVVDALDTETLRQHRLLLLAQPRALPPAALVDIDNWVRNGGAAVVFADPQLLWPTDLPLGDARAPLPSTLLGPLLTHWGLAQTADAQTGDQVTSFADGGQRLHIRAAGRWQAAAGARCTLNRNGVIARCRVGRGHVTLIADADMLHRDLWQGSDHADSVEHMRTLGWSAGTPLWLDAEVRRLAALPPELPAIPPVWRR